MQPNVSPTTVANREAPIDHGHPYPPGHLRFRVHGGRDIEGYARNGRMASENLVALFVNGLLSLPAGANVLDFGCGPGRVMTWFQQEHKDWNFFGTDIDPEAIEWAQKNLPGLATFDCNGHLPPLRYETGFFDFVYSISIFSHLPEDMQGAWLAELSRVTKPGGCLVLTTHGEALVPEEYRYVLKDGFHYSSGAATDGLPEFYQTSYQTQEYVRRVWSQYFTIENYFVRGLGNHQDLVICRKPPSLAERLAVDAGVGAPEAAGPVRRWLKRMTGNA
jgi:SAM-dependent methyltransferase